MKTQICSIMDRPSYRLINWWFHPVPTTFFMYYIILVDILLFRHGTVTWNSLVLIIIGISMMIRFYLWCKSCFFKIECTLMIFEPFKEIEQLRNEVESSNMWSIITAWKCFHLWTKIYFHNVVELYSGYETIDSIQDRYPLKGWILISVSSISVLTTCLHSSSRVS